MSRPSPSTNPRPSATSTIVEPIFNLEPRVGEPARFGFYVIIANSPVFIDTSVRTGGDYGVTVNVPNITQTAAFLSSETVFWGVPGDSRHDKQRGWGCIDEARGLDPSVRQACLPSGEAHPQAVPHHAHQLRPAAHHQHRSGQLGTPPANCATTPASSSPEAPLEGCNHLQFAPEIEVKPDGQEASKPTGLTVDVHVPQEVNNNAAGDASSNVRDITVKFPVGVVVNPASADGLQACSETQVGLQPGTGIFGEHLFTPALPEPLLQGVNFCPDASKVGTVTIKSPLLPKGQYVEGALYLATPAPEREPGKNPFDTLIAAYILAHDPISGTVVKLPGQVTLDAATGQITSTFENSPQLAFEDAEIHLFGGERAPFATPAHCGTYRTEATFTPWSATPPVKSTSSFEVTIRPRRRPVPARRAAVQTRRSRAARRTSAQARSARSRRRSPAKTETRT